MWRKHEGKCLAGSNFFSVGKIEEKTIDCPLNGETDGDDYRRVQPSPSLVLVEVRSKTNFMH